MSEKVRIVLDPDDLFDRVLMMLKAIHDRKKADYSNPEDRFSNFTEAANAAGTSTETVFETLIAIKQARIKQLLTPGRDAQNESLLDSYLDRAVYSALAYAWKMSKEEDIQVSDKEIARRSVEETVRGLGGLDYYKSPTDGKLYLKDKG